ncbi:altronate dehydratase family protein [Pullulanibacillus sp. KACC 23026]|uniref:UxaA family hydrolase n=1 Tax=Pullulanibacillus sp. KACC 23026 TaxID=3028315 RepID=UPI0023AFFA31|nr:altronate dehydratase family protein [Pullulanibacillus sp. KACC 23026]WEG13683.1 altronate dehydratase family protein [Pullulanibacillus sp. KACC 23026]
MADILKINEKDNVVVALKDLDKGQPIFVNDQEIELLEDVKRGHKIAITRIKGNENVVKYGYPIGHATTDIPVGAHVHTHNTKTNLDGVQDYAYQPKLAENPFKNEHLTFKGFKRKNGEVGIRNELWIVPTVGCVNGVAETIIKRFEKEVGDISPFEAILVLRHNYGCSQLGDDHVNTRSILQDAVHHPNAGGVLVLGLGCENNDLYEFEESLGEFDPNRVKFLVSQEVSNEIEEGVKLLKEIYEAAKEDRREEVPLSELKIGLKCGGSDGLSGITANPLLGRLSDFLVAQGGTTVLTEVPEMFGAETILMERAHDEAIFSKTVDLINEFKQYFIKNNQPIYENPSPGNKAGGITTLEDKSLGCTQKAGTSVVMDVLKYGERLKTKGLNLLSSPGNDLVASSALAAAGCQLVLFTTGRGTPFGTFVPTMKVSSNTAIFEAKPHWIDYNAGVLLEESPDVVLKDFIQYVIRVASGEQVNNEKNDFRELAIFKTGVTL